MQMVNFTLKGKKTGKQSPPPQKKNTNINVALPIYPNTCVSFKSLRKSSTAPNVS